MSSWPAGQVMTEHLAGLGPLERGALARVLCEEIDGLVGSNLADDHATAATWPKLRAELAERLGADLDGPSRALAAALATDRRRPLVSFVEDLAEILFVPRAQRSEYLFNRQPSPPWRIERLLLEYATWVRRLEAHQDALTKGMCARSCERLPVGCCSVLGYDLGLVPDRMLSLQRLEARRAGWSRPEREVNCRYHTPTGCVLRLFKSPACIGFLCEGLQTDLLDRFGPRAQALIDALARFQTCDLDRTRIFEQMRLTIQAGQALLAGPLRARGEGT